MRSSVIIDLINAHSTNNEDEFEKLIKILSEEERKKGNLVLSDKILKTYKTNKNSINKNNNYKGNDSYFSTMSQFNDQPDFSSSSLNNLMTPKDKDSLLNLYEIIYPEVSLNEVVLPEMQKELIYQIISEYERRDELFSLNLKPTNRILLCGPPGCGKTMTATAIAHELKLPTAYVRLDALISSYLGQTGTNIRKIFDSVKGRPIVLFLDEFDAIAKKRDDGQELGELKRVVTTILQNFDMLDDNIFLIAATNHEHLLDPAIWRRFNAVININPPTLQQREELLKTQLNNYNFVDTLSLTKVAQIMNGINCSQLKEIVQQAVKRALITLNKNVVTSDDVVLSYIKYLTNNSSSNDIKDNWEVLKNIKNNGVPLRLLEEATGIPKSTISDNINKCKKEDI